MYLYYIFCHSKYKAVLTFKLSAGFLRIPCCFKILLHQISMAALRHVFGCAKRLQIGSITKAFYRPINWPICNTERGQCIGLGFLQQFVFRVSLIIKSSARVRSFPAG